MHTDEIDLLLAAEITLFFERNPFTVETAEGLARKLGRRSEHVRPVLDRLAERHLIQRDRNSRLYSYIPPFTDERL